MIVIMWVVLELSPDLIITLIRHVTSPICCDRTTGPWLKAPPIDTFSSSEKKRIEILNMSPCKLLNIDIKVMSREAASQIL